MFGYPVSRYSKTWSCKAKEIENKIEEKKQTKTQHFFHDFQLSGTKSLIHIVSKEEWMSYIKVNMTPGDAVARKALCAFPLISFQSP